MEDADHDYLAPQSSVESDLSDLGCSTSSSVDEAPSSVDGVRHRRGSHHEGGKNYRADLERMTSRRNFSIDASGRARRPQRRASAMINNAPNASTAAAADTTSERPEEVGQSDKVCFAEQFSI